MPDRETKQLSIEILERRENPDSPYHNGTQVMEASIVYRKDGRPRGYYLRVQVYRQLDNGGILCEIFGDPSKRVLIEEAKMFSEKKLASLSVRPDILLATLAEVKGQYANKRAAELQKQESIAV